MKKSCIAMLLAGGQGSRLYALTQDVAKPNMPFGGKYRIIDFPLSNCANSGIDTVGVLTQYRPLQLNSYIGGGQPWDLDSTDGGVFILPPYQTAGETGSWFSGTANAIYQNIGFIEMYDPDNVLILSGDHIYKMDYSKMLREHVEKDAACTIAVLQVSMEDATRFGIMNLGPDGYVEQFEEKPKQPKSDLASMGIYIFNWKKLRKYLIEDENDPTSSKDFGKNIIPNMLKAGEKLWPYRFDAQERALRGGMRGVSFSALLGLDDFRKDALASALHVYYINRKYPHAELSLSCPRLRPIINNDKINPRDVGEKELCQILCAYRIFLPYVGITVSSRENERFRNGITHICATKVSAGVSTGVGDHETKYEGKEDADVGDEQFEIDDNRSFERMYKDMEAGGLQPVLNDYLYV